MLIFLLACVSGNTQNSSYWLFAYKIVLVLSCTTFILTRKNFAFNYFELFCTCVIFLIALSSRIFDLELLNYLLFIFVLYVALKLLFSQGSIQQIEFFLLNIFSLLLFSLFAFSIYIFYNYDEPSNIFFSINSSIFSIVLASLISFVLPLIIKIKTSLFYKTLYFISLFTAVLLMASTNGRTGWLCCIITGLFIGYQYLQKKEHKNFVLLFNAGLIILVFSLLFFYKSGSSNGRLLIQKISFRLFKENWLVGIGQGQFRVQYNLAQAKYFSTNDIDGVEALLADNTFYAFNDYFEFIIEHGMLGFLVIVFFIFFYVRLLKNVFVNNENKSLFIAAQSCLLCIFIACFFSYSLKNFPTVFLLLICFSIIASLPQKIPLNYNLKIRGHSVFKIFCFIVAIFLSFYYFYSFFYELKIKEAYELKQVGFKTKSLTEYKKINGSYIKNGPALYNYAEELFNVNKLEEAKVVVNALKKMYTANDIYILSANIEAELKNIAKAEQDYKTAIFMVPNRMVSRKKLLDFYIQQKDTIPAIFWAKSIINMPVKVRSNITESIQVKTKLILSGLLK